jgi:hypothetical protein
VNWICLSLICTKFTNISDQFNDQKRTWLVIWELGVVIQLPPWVFIAYPSSLFFHFNIDIHGKYPKLFLVQDSKLRFLDIHFVSTDGDIPTPDNSEDFTDGDDQGRGSFVFYNQASMFQGPETNFDTIKKAKAHGHCGTSDAQYTAQEAFSDMTRYFHVNSIL